MYCSVCTGFAQCFTADIDGFRFDVKNDMQINSIYNEKISFETDQMIIATYSR